MAAHQVCDLAVKLTQGEVASNWKRLLAATEIWAACQQLASVEVIKFRQWELGELRRQATVS